MNDDTRHVLKLARDALATADDQGVEEFKAIAAINAVLSRSDPKPAAPCRYPGCVENEDERCPRWLVGACDGPRTVNESLTVADPAAPVAIEPFGPIARALLPTPLSAPAAPVAPAVIVDFSATGWRALVDALRALPDGTRLYAAPAAPVAQRVSAADELTPAAPVAQPVSEPDFTRIAFEAWWKRDGEYLRAGGGDYEKTFAWHAWQEALKIPCECEFIKASQPVSEPSDADIDAAMESALGSHYWANSANQQDILRRAARAVLALRPAVQPLTLVQINQIEMTTEWPEGSLRNIGPRDWGRLLVTATRAIERAHGIGQGGA